MKNILRYVLSGTMMFGILMMIPACKTSEPGIKSSLRSQWATMPGDPVKVTEAARQVLEEFKLRKIDSKSTGVDGHAEGFKSDETKVSVDVGREGPNTSSVTVTIGSLGDPALGKDILLAIQKKVGG